MPRAIQFDPTASFTTSNTTSTTAYTYAYFPFDTDTSETIHNRSVTVGGSPTISTSTNFVFTGALNINGNGYVKINNSQSAARFSGPFTIQFFIKFNSHSGNHQGPIGAHIGNGWLMQVNSSETLFWMGGSYIISSSTVPATGQWHHMAVTRNSSNLVRLFLNGSSLGSLTYNGNMPAGGDIVIGGSNTSGQYVQGLMDDVLILDGFCLYDSSSYTVPTAASGGAAQSIVNDTRSYASVFDLRSQYKERAAGAWPT